MPTGVVNSSFGRWLRRLRAENHLSQSELATGLDYSRELVAKVEQGQRPGRVFVDRLSRLLRLAPELHTELLRFALAGQESQSVPPWAHGLTIALGFRERPHNLPAPLASLVGRDREVGCLYDRLLRRSVRLVTLVGPPGIGKSRLALQVATEAVGRFMDGAQFVALSEVREPSFVAPAIAVALGVREVSGRSLPEVIGDRLRKQQQLLVLDNFEHLLEAGPFLLGLLESAPELKLLITSRAAVELYGEHRFEVLPLAVPQSARRLDSSTAEQYASVQLFVERAQAANAAFTLDDHNAADVSEICRRLDGIPLLIELAAARCWQLTPSDILGQLATPSKVLAAGADGRHARLHSWRAAMDWSYEFLDERAQAVFAHLAVFAGGAEPRVAEMVCAVAGSKAATHEAVREGLASLIRHNLVRRSHRRHAAERLEVLESIRGYAAERLIARDEGRAVGLAHAEYFTRFAEQAEPELRGARQREWADQVEADYDNLRAALSWATSAREDDGLDPPPYAVGARLAVALSWFWFVRGRWSEGRQWLERVLARPAGGDANFRLAVLCRAGQLAWAQTDYPAAVGYCEEAVALARSTGDRVGLALSLGVLAHVGIARGDFARAEQLAEDVLRLFSELDDAWGLAMTHTGLGVAAIRQGAYEYASVHLETALREHRRSGDIRGQAEVLNNLGLLARILGDLNRAADLHEQSLALFRELRDDWQAAAALNNLAAVATRRGHYQRGMSLHADAAQLYRNVGDQRGVATTLEYLANVLLSTGRPERAAWLLGAAGSLRETLGASPAEHERLQVLHVHSGLRDALGESGFSSALTRGRGTALDQVLDLAQEAVSGQRP